MDAIPPPQLVSGTSPDWPLEKKSSDCLLRDRSALTSLPYEDPTRTLPGETAPAPTGGFAVSDWTQQMRSEIFLLRPVYFGYFCTHLVPPPPKPGLPEPCRRPRACSPKPELTVFSEAEDRSCTAFVLPDQVVPVPACLLSADCLVGRQQHMLVSMTVAGAAG